MDSLVANEILQNTTRIARGEEESIVKMEFVSVMKSLKFRKASGIDDIRPVLNMLARREQKFCIEKSRKHGKKR